MNAPAQSAIWFNQAAVTDTPPLGDFVTFAIRTDALHATDLLIRGLAETTRAKSRDINASHAVKEAYRDWGRDVLIAFASHLDYKQYGFENRDTTPGLNVQFYDARDLAKHTLENARQMVQPGEKPFLISLDDMIGKEGEADAEIAFSRLFSLDGEGGEKDYVERPGHPPISRQLVKIANQLQPLHEATGKRVPIVLLEDNVRRAKMLNWVIDLMETHGIMRHGYVAGISTSFCNANAEERAKILSEGKSVPVKAVVDCDTRCVVDVATTRDLLFDGFVTEYQGTIGRLPGIFMNVVDRFKIAPERADDFLRDTIKANITFCESIEREFGVQLPLAWFDGGEIISKIAGVSKQAPMLDILKRAQAKLGLAKIGNDNRQEAAGTTRPAVTTGAVTGKAACNPV